jgi:hypothetical protein
VYKNIYTTAVGGDSNHPANATAGMCAQGFSAGSAAVAYSLAYYGAVLDNVELISGPVLSDIEQGCEVPLPPTLTLVCPPGQAGCNLGPGGSDWTASPSFVEMDLGFLRSWTNDSSCVNTSATSPTSNAAWLAQSIVDQSTGGAGQGAVPTFTYSTAMTAWLCRSLQNPSSICNGSDYMHCPNNSASQGEIFYSQITSANAPPHYKIYAVDLCNGPEGVPLGYVGSPTGPPAGTALEQDMAGGGGVTAQCFHGKHTQ